MDGQGGSMAKGLFANRFQAFNRNSISGANGILLWGLGNADALVAGNSFANVEVTIGIDQFPVGVDTVQNYVLYNNSNL